MNALKEEISKEITALFEACLDFAQVATPEANYKQLRSKILRAGNNAIRNIKAFIDKNYK